MTPIAIVVLIAALIILWGGLAASIVFLRRQPEVASYPPAGLDDHREDDAPVIHDT